MCKGSWPRSGLRDCPVCRGKSVYPVRLQSPTACRRSPLYTKGPFKGGAGLRLSPPPASREPPRRGGLSGAQRLMAPSVRELSAKLTEGETLSTEPLYSLFAQGITKALGLFGYCENHLPAGQRAGRSGSLLRCTVSASVVSPSRWGRARMTMRASSIW